ncbi:hypothetical protein E3T39_12245 [Cryobacterium suzukii]|uniref:Uncharacterized protein n=1 Tax=Cryobacterium suzukii TaxID=1259198 RepID=A0A4R9AED5_9MICO|nr:hypothetical protein [Cryobacterium suzukii]TFD59116.1 hypothetical protein E3T39_12245 [Cryobacterium suzukii]
MTPTFAFTLAGASALIFLARLVMPRLPLAKHAVRLSVVDTVLLVGGVGGLAFHCAAMFYRPIFDGTPFGPLVDMVNDMNVASIILYVVPAVLVLIGVRRQHWVSLAVLALALLFVGVTMYAGSPLNVHLGAIFVAVVALVSQIALLAIAPWRRAARP